MLALHRLSSSFLRTLVFKQFASSTIAVQSINDKVEKRVNGEQPAPVVKTAVKAKSKYN